MPNFRLVSTIYLEWLAVNSQRVTDLLAVLSAHLNRRQQG